MKKLGTAAFLLMAALAPSAHAHPTFIRIGYLNCVGCHYSPEGAGLLTPYGQGIAQATSLPGGELDENTPGAIVQALTLKGRLHHGLQGRVMSLQRGRPVGGRKRRTFPMQFDYLSQMDWTPSLRHELILAVAPKSASSAGVDSTSAQD